MATNKKGKISCLGLFFKTGIISFLLLTILTVACVIVGVQFFGADYAAWTDLSSLKSYPWIAMTVVGALSMLLAFGGGVFAIIANLILSGAKKPGAGSSRSKARPQSNRRTTI